MKLMKGDSLEVSDDTPMYNPLGLPLILELSDRFRKFALNYTILRRAGVVLLSFSPILSQIDPHLIYILQF